MGVTISRGKWNYKVVAEHSRKKKNPPCLQKEETGSVAGY